MNIIAAVKLRTWIRRASKKSMSFRFGINDEVIEFTRDDILADDWEVESQPVTITREQFNEAWDSAIDSSQVKETNCVMLHHYLTKELGL
jgi:hypothetical protein